MGASRRRGGPATRPLHPRPLRRRRPDGARLDRRLPGRGITHLRRSESARQSPRESASFQRRRDRKVRWPLPESVAATDRVPPGNPEIGRGLRSPRSLSSGRSTRRDPARLLGDRARRRFLDAPRRERIFRGGRRPRCRRSFDRSNPARPPDTEGLARRPGLRRLHLRVDRRAQGGDRLASRPGLRVSRVGGCVPTEARTRFASADGGSRLRRLRGRLGPFIVLRLATGAMPQGYASRSRGARPSDREGADRRRRIRPRRRRRAGRLPGEFGHAARYASFDRRRLGCVAGRAVRASPSSFRAVPSGDQLLRVDRGDDR